MKKIVELFCLGSLLMTAPVCFAEGLNGAPLAPPTLTTWLDVAYYGSTQKNSVNGFDQHHVYATIENRLSKSLQGLFTVEWEHTPIQEPAEGDSKGAIKVDSAWIAYAINSQHSFKMGNFFNPLGFWMPTHWAILMESQEKPLLTKNAYFPLNLIGVNYYGKISTDRSEILYNALVANGADTQSGSSSLDKNNGKAVALDVRIIDDDYTLGAGIYYDPQRDLGALTGSDTGVLLYGSYTPMENMNLRSEVLLLKRTYTHSVINYYVNLNYYLTEKLLSTLRLDYAQDKSLYPQGQGSKSMTTLVLRYKPEQAASFKLETSLHQVAEQDPYLTYGLSSGLMF